ncbi:hypothetical protein ACPPVS_12630 [Cellulomonas sp. McL0617]|uniref:hypothetical protein n=1 Tax=Cellulomonas sp. McL0617 TaxID=3415675 RepID=UPI003CEE4361
MPTDVECAPYSTFCVIEVELPGQGAATPVAPPVDDGLVARVCTISRRGEVVPCHSELGWFDDQGECYWLLLDPQPPDGVYWEGHYPDGAMYDVTCTSRVPGASGGWTWRATSPPGAGNAPTPQQVAQRAIALMGLSGPAIRTTVPADGFGIVGVPVWLWTDVMPTTWGPTSATASIAGLSVTANAQARQIVWAMGDGLSETCRSPGTPYYTGGVTSPTCQHIYQQHSGGQPGQEFPVTATTTWDVTWSGGGASGSLSVTRTSATSVRIGEVQVLVTQE